MQGISVAPVFRQECRQDWKTRWTLKVDSSESLGSIKIGQNLDGSSPSTKIQKVVVCWYWVSLLSQPDNFYIVYQLQEGSGTLTRPGQALPVDWIRGPG